MNRLLVILPYVPYPIQRGTFQRVFNLTEQLAKKFTLDLFCFSDSLSDINHISVFESFCNRVKFVPFEHPPWPKLFPTRLFESLPSTVTHWYSEDVLHELEKFVEGEEYQIVQFCDIVLWPYVEHCFENHNCIVMDRSRVDWLFQTEELKILDLSLKEKFLRKENLRKIKNLEKKVYQTIAMEIVCGLDDKVFLKDKLGYAEKIFVLPNGYNANFFDHEEWVHKPRGKPTALFCGALDYSPNVDGLAWYFEKIHQSVMKLIPDFTLLLVGKNPTEKIKEFSKLAGVEFIGEVPDVRPYYQQSWLQIVPLRIGGGTRLKIVESMGLKIPVVSTQIGAQGIDLTHDRDILIADSPLLFAQEISRFIQDSNLRSKLANNGLYTVQSNYTWPKLADKLSNKLMMESGIILPDKEPKVTVLLGLPFHSLTMRQTVLECEKTIRNRTPAYFATANMDFVAQAYKDDELRNLLFYAHRILCDGRPLVWLSHLFKSPLPERVAGSDLLPELLDNCAKNGFKVYFFGSDDDTLLKAKQILQSQFLGLEIIGMQSPPMGQFHEWDNNKIVREIKSVKPDVLLVALGCPKQERWIYVNHKETEVPLSIGIGASLDFVSGKQKRAPLFVQNLGLEWAWRLLSNPKRLYKRYFRDFISFYFLTQKQVLALRKNNTVRPTIDCSIIKENPEIEIIKLTGKVDASTIENINIPEKYDKAVVCDCSEVKFIDSSGLGILAKISRDARERNVYFGILNPSKIVQTVIEAVRLTQQLPFCGDISEIIRIINERNNKILSIIPSADSETLSIELLGNLGSDNIDSFQSEFLFACESVTKYKTVLLDLNTVKFIDSSAVGKFLSIKKELRSREIDFWIVNINGVPLQTLEILKLDTILIRDE